MALRDLVMGGGACAVPGAPASSSNPLGGLADSLLGSASKTQERLKELPGLVGPGQSSAEFGVSRPLASLPGSEFEQDVSQQSNIQVPEFLRKFHGVDQHGLADAWNEALGVQMPPPPFFQENRGSPAIFSEFEQIYGRDVTSGPPALLDGTPQRVLSGFLRSFLDSSRGEVPFHPVKLPELGLSEADKCRIRDRSSIMARHFFADKGDEYVNAQVNALLHSLDIESELRAWGPQDGRFSELEDHWNETHGGRLYPRQGGNSNIFDNSNQWATEFNQQHDLSNGVENWVNEYQQHEDNVWVDQFGQEQAQMTRAHLRDGDMRNLAALEQTRSLVHTLSQNQDPKFQNSKFLQFVSKMSRGELIVEDNQVKPSVSSEASGWADEFGSQHAGNTESWAAEFTAGEHSHRGDTWVDQYGRERNQESSTSEGWIDDFSKMNMRDWADEFNDQFANGTLGDDNWLNSYEKFVEEQVAGEHKLPSSSRWAYVFADQNPYVGHPNPLKEGHELFRRGLLSEAVLALEAEVLKNPDNAEGWRLLGITHAENDDDRQAIASMVRARDADPTNLEVLLALGVSHTNELEQHEALKYLRGWLQHHPKYGRLVPSDPTERLNHLEVTPLFHEAAQMSPEDGDVHTVLGVLYNLSREYDKAIAAFQTALKLKPRDYSLWNKLGATQANSARSADAIHAYQEALDLKPNYVRAWSNMGISYANQGRYEESIRYYVRALCMNPKADNAWQYLRISLSCAARTDLLDACDRRDLDSLQKEFPM